MAKKLKQRRPDGSLDLRVDLKKDHADMLIKIMDERKLPYYAEAVRYCITEASMKTEFHLEEVYWNKIKNFLDFDIVKNKKHIYNMQDFVNKALEYYFDHLESSVESVMSFDVRSELNEDELDVAMALLSCQEKSYQEQVTVEEVADYLNRRNIQSISTVLESFVIRGILSRIVHKGRIFYHAKPLPKYD